MLEYIIVLFVTACQGCPRGAPENACGNMTPRHRVPPQRAPAPFSITVSTKVVKPGVPMEVVLSGEGPSDFINGFLLQARHGSRLIGTFGLGHNHRLAQLMDCGAPGDSITHKYHDRKFNKLAAAFTWTPPENVTKEFTFRFRATVAKSFTVFWVGIESPPILVRLHKPSAIPYLRIHDRHLCKL